MQQIALESAEKAAGEKRVCSRPSQSKLPIAGDVFRRENASCFFMRRMGKGIDTKGKIRYCNFLRGEKGRTRRPERQVSAPALDPTAVGNAGSRKTRFPCFGEKEGDRMKKIDAHLHLAQIVAGYCRRGELRAIGGGRAA